MASRIDYPTRELSPPEGYLHSKIDQILKTQTEHTEILKAIQSSIRYRADTAIIEFLLSPRVAKLIGSGMLAGAGYLLSRLTG